MWLPSTCRLAHPHRSYWGELFNGRRPVSPEIRRALLASRHTKAIPEEQLWEVRTR